MRETLRSLLPDVYATILPELFDRPTPSETKATCANCAMCASGGASAEGATYFRPDAKCCTYHPVLPNYLVGAILADPREEMAEGQRRIRAKIEARMAVSPHWIAAPRKTSVLLRASREHAFGRSLALLCPYFEREGGRCTIWRHRESVCSTFFCKYVDGAAGQRFWRAAKDLVAVIERQLALHAARAILPNHRERWTDDLTIEDLEDRPPSDASYAALWGDWVGREAEFYVKTSEWVRGLDRAEFERAVVDEAYESRAAATAAAHDALSDRTLPERLRPNPAMTRRPVADGVLVTSYSRYEPLHLTPALDHAVAAFNLDEPVAEVRARLAREEIHVPDELIFALYRYRVLVPEEPTPPSP
ncbi:MAG: hypothetical protein U0414_24940 [Polyangiaceae bacterium]